MVRFVVMAAGMSKRMGRDKLALPWGNVTVLASVLGVVLETIDSSLTQAELRVIARNPISTYLSDELIEVFKSKGGVWIQVSNPQPVSETIRTGLIGVPKNVQGVCFVPADQVGITPKVFGDLFKSFIVNVPDFLVPIADNQAGAPVFFHQRYLQELLALEGEQGGKVVLNRYREHWSTYPVEGSFFNDVDTPEQYEYLSRIEIT